MENVEAALRPIVRQEFFNRLGVREAVRDAGRPRASKHCRNCNWAMPRDEAQTRIELIDPALWARGWSEELIRRDKMPGGVDIVEGVPRRRRGRSDYLLCLPILPGKPPLIIALIEAKAESKLPALGLQQGRDYQRRFNVPFVFSTNGYLYAAYGDDTRTIKDNLPLGDFPTPEELRARYEAHRGFSLESDAARPLVMPYKGGGGGPLLRRVAITTPCGSALGVSA